MIVGDVEPRGATGQRFQQDKLVAGANVAAVHEYPTRDVRLALLFDRLTGEQDAVLAARRAAKELRRVREFLLEPQHAARRSDRHAPVQSLLVAVGHADAVGGVAAEVEAGKRSNEAVGAGGQRAPDHDRGAEQQSVEPYHWRLLSPAVALFASLSME